MSEILELNDDTLHRLAAVLAAQLVERMGKKPEPLWTGQQVSEYLGCGPRQVSERYAKLPDFPRPIEMPSPTGESPRLRWIPEEIIAWVKQHKRAA